MASEVRRIEEMSWFQIKNALESGVDTVVAAAGSMEQHGPHMPMITDTLLGTVIADGVAARMGNVLRGPTIPFGVSEHHMAFRGTITLDKETFKTVVKQYVQSLAHHGFKTVIIIPSHGGNFGPLKEIEEETGGEINGARYLPYTDLWEFVAVMNAVAEPDGISPEVSGAHAGEAETSMVLAERPELVDMSRAEAGFVEQMNEEHARRLFEEGMTALTDNGILGDARPADAARGRRYIDSMADYLAEWFSERRPG
jgi:creatinine amidohydrolase/Fe(II)-dependent formamide hydrolase-like protein